MSAAATSPAPPPSAAPWTRATTAFGEVSTVSKRSRSAPASARLSSREKCAAAFIQAMSAPAQNTAPWPASTITRTSSRAEAARTLSRSSCAVGPSSALRASGRASATCATGPSRVSATRASPMATASMPRPSGTLGRCRHPRHVSGAVMVHVTAMLGLAHAYYVLDLRHAEGWIGYGTHIDEARYGRLARIGPRSSSSATPPRCGASAARSTCATRSASSRRAQSSTRAGRPRSSTAWTTRGRATRRRGCRAAPR